MSKSPLVGGTAPLEDAEEEDEMEEAFEADDTGPLLTAFFGPSEMNTKVLSAIR
jgi:hypothetical protein